MWESWWERGSLVSCVGTMSIVPFVFLLLFVVTRAIHSRVDSPPCLVLMTGRR